MEKQYDLFGNEIIFIKPSGKKKEKTLFDDYEGFADKFKQKKTTDDCYTPQPVYDCILKHVTERCDIKGCQIVRPFYPGGDYENCDYPENCVVIDNPPFSIISKIARFYINNNIKFFLFAPHLTLFSSDLDCTRIVCCSDIIYENGAIVKTSFLSNLFGDIAIMSWVDLNNDIKKVQKENKKLVNLPKYVYPSNVLTISMVAWCVERGIDIQFNKDQVYLVRGLDDQKKHGKAIFGSGFLISEKAAAEKAAAEKATAIVWKLSPRELEIIKKLK